MKELIVLEIRNSFGHPTFYNGRWFTRQIGCAVAYPSLAAALAARDRLNAKHPGGGTGCFFGCTVSVRERP